MKSISRFFCWFMAIISWISPFESNAQNGKMGVLWSMFNFSKVTYDKPFLVHGFNSSRTSELDGINLELRSFANFGLWYRHQPRNLFLYGELSYNSRSFLFKGPDEYTDLKEYIDFIHYSCFQTPLMLGYQFRRFKPLRFTISAGPMAELGSFRRSPLFSVIPLFVKKGKQADLISLFESEEPDPAAQELLDRKREFILHGMASFGICFYSQEIHFRYTTSLTKIQKEDLLYSANFQQFQTFQMAVVFTINRFKKPLKRKSVFKNDI